MNSIDEPTRCEIHVWEPFLDTRGTIEFANPMRYFRICMGCGIIELRDREREYDSSI